jgi:hypothetical protein
MLRPELLPHTEQSILVTTTNHGEIQMYVVSIGLYNACHFCSTVTKFYLKKIIHPRFQEYLFGESSTAACGWTDITMLDAASGFANALKN